MDYALSYHIVSFHLEDSHTLEHIAQRDYLISTPGSFQEPAE